MYTEEDNYNGGRKKQDIERRKRSKFHGRSKIKGRKRVNEEKNGNQTRKENIEKAFKIVRGKVKKMEDKISKE